MLIKGTRRFEMTIDTIWSLLVAQLESNGYDVTIEANYAADFKHGIVELSDKIFSAPVSLDLILMTLDDDPFNVEIRFVFTKESLTSANAILWK